jgi:aldose 1-epimerase
MTCPPDAFTTGVDLIVLEPGAESTASWLLSATDGGS